MTADREAGEPLEIESGVTVILPALDEEGGIGATLSAIGKAFEGRDEPLEILVVDDGSRDGTREVALAAGARVISHPKPGGYGRSLRTGILAAAHPVIAIVDADGTYPVEELPTMVDRLARFDMVVGVRTGPLYRRKAFFSPVRTAFLLLTNFVTGTWIPDPNSGLRVFRRATVLPLLPRLPRGFSFTTTLTLILTLSGRFIDYYPVDYRRRVGRSKVRLVRDALRAGQTLVEVVLRHNPLKLFLALSIVPAIAAGVVLALSSFIAQAALAATVLLATAVLVFAIGMLAVVAMDERRLR